MPTSEMWQGRGCCVRIYHMLVPLLKSSKAVAYEDVWAPSPRWLPRSEGRRDDDMDGKFLFMRNDMEEQETGLPGRDCKICLESGQTT